MGKLDGLSERYSQVRSDLEEWLPRFVRAELANWASGEDAARYFGSHANSLDALFLIAVYEKQLPYALWRQVQAALSEGHSWNEIAVALGVSRQAARKRFG